MNGLTVLYSQRPQRKSVRSAGTRARVPRSVWDGGWDGGQPLSPPRLARSRTELNRDQVLRLFYFTQYSIVIARKVKFTIGDWAEEGGDFELDNNSWVVGYRIRLVAEALS